MENNLLDVANKIFEKIQQHDVEQVVFYANNAYLFCEPEQQAILELLKKQIPERIKFRIIKNGRWTDSSKYFNLSSFVECDKSLDFIYKYNYSEYETIVRKNLYDAVLNDNKFNKTLIAELLSKIKSHGSDLSLFVKGYLQSLLNESYKEQHEVKIKTAQDAAFALLRAAFLSLTNRRAAEKIYFKVQSSKFKDIVNYLGLDLGANTYFDLNEKDYEVAENNALIKVWHNLEIKPINSITMALSMDLNFFRIYGPLLMFYIHHTKNIDFQLLIIDDEFETSKKWACNYLEELASLTGFDTAKNFNFHFINTPNFVASAKTFYACARFFIVPALLKNYKKVYVMDADLTPMKDFVEYVSGFKDSVTVNKNRGCTSLYPWRRVMAGNVAFVNSNDQKAELFLKHTLTYMIKGLYIEKSWTLDQNALCFATEKVECSTLAGQPFTQHPIRAQWEKNILNATRALN